MKWTRFLLLLFLIPNLIYASFDQDKCTKKTNEIMAEWNKHTEFVQKANICGSNEQEKIAGFLREAIACCQRAIKICDNVLKEISDKDKNERHKKY